MSLGRRRADQSKGLRSIPAWTGRCFKFSAKVAERLMSSGLFMAKRMRENLQEAAKFWLKCQQHKKDRRSCPECLNGHFCSYLLGPQNFGCFCFSCPKRNFEIDAINQVWANLLKESLKTFIIISFVLAKVKFFLQLLWLKTFLSPMISLTFSRKLQLSLIFSHQHLLLVL